MSSLSNELLLLLLMCPVGWNRREVDGIRRHLWCIRNHRKVYGAFFDDPTTTAYFADALSEADLNCCGFCLGTPALPEVLETS